MVINIILGLILGYVISYFLSGKKTGDKGPFGFIKIPVSKKKFLHIHHWLVFIIILLLFKNLFIEHHFILGLIFGIIIEDFRYKDFYIFLYERK